MFYIWKNYKKKDFKVIKCCWNIPPPICTNITAVKLWPGSWFNTSNKNGTLLDVSVNVGKVNRAPGAVFQINPFRKGYSGKRSRIICAEEEMTIIIIIIWVKTQQN